MDRLDRELESEQQFHIEARAEELVKSGMTAEDAALEARKQFGNRLLIREASHEARVLPWLESMLQDAHFGVRIMKRDSVVTAAAALSLSLAIGACTAAFSLIDALIFRPLPVHEPKSLFFLTYPPSRNLPIEEECCSYLLMERMIEAARPRVDFFGISSEAVRRRVVFDGSGGQEEKVHTGSTTGDAFEILGIQPALGRLLTASDNRRFGEQQAAVLGHDFWLRRFGGDPDILGRGLALAGRHFVIVGVASKGFSGVQPGFMTDLWVPSTIPPAGADPWAGGAQNWMRLKPGVAPEQARLILQVVSENFRREYAGRLFPPDAPRTEVERFINAKLNLRSAANGGPSFLRYEFEHPLWILALVACLVLLIACSNVANLFIARTAAREREMALRLSIGAGRRRLIQQVLIESSLLAAGACALGLGFACASAQLIVDGLMPADNPAYLDLRIDYRMLAFAALIGVLTTVLFGLIPALRTSAVSPMDALKTASVKHSASIGTLRPVLAVQMGFSFAVLFIAGLLLLSFQRLTSVDLGFPKAGMLLFSMEGKDDGRGDGGRTATMQLLDQVRQLRGVQSASLSRWPLLGGPFAPIMTAELSIPGRTPDARGPGPYYLEVAQGFFETMRIPVLDGREFVARDTEPEHPTTAIVNQAFARVYFPGENPLGRKFETTYGPNLTVSQEIVGLVQNAKYNSVREPPIPIVYIPLRSIRGADSNGATLEVRTTIDPGILAPGLREEIQHVEPSFHVTDVMLQSTWTNNELLSERLLALLSTFFGLVAIVLVAVGLYGVLCYSVVLRTREIGIRMALGARQPMVVRLVMGDVVPMIAVGLVAGISVGFALARFLATILFEVKPSDFSSLALPLVCLLAISALAALAPTLRAARVDPIKALRYE